MAERPAPQLVCRDLVELVTERLDGALSPDEATAFDRHLADCGGCGAYVAQFRTTIRAVQALGSRAGSLEPRELARSLAAWRRARAGT